MMKRYKPAHMTDNMEECLGRLLRVTEAVNQLFGQHQGSMAQSRGRPGSVNTATARVAAYDIENLDEHCPLPMEKHAMWAIADLHRTLERMVEEHPDGEEVPFEDIQGIQIDLRVFTDEFIRNLV